MRSTRIAGAGLILVLAGGCATNPLGKFGLSDEAPPEYRADVAAALERAGENAPELVAVLRSVAPEMRRGAAFVLATMPYPDVATARRDALLEHIEYAYRARDRYAWGPRIPEEIFLHYVLPYRCAEEPIERYRKYFYEQLDPIVAPLTSMADVAHQVNLWLGGPRPDGRPRVRFVQTEARDQGPFETLRAGFGRCEEMMIVYMAAARSVGLPCRSAWTPCWAVCDNNHAWVEVWVDGRWTALGGCEPGPPWFEHPAKRVAAVYCAALGRPSSEPIYKSSGVSSLVDSTANYSRTCAIEVRTLSADGRPLPGTPVAFSVFNWGSFRPFTMQATDAEGRVRFRVGIGEYLLTAGNEEACAWRVVRTEPDAPQEIELRLTPGAAPEGYLFLRYPTLDEARAGFELPSLAPTARDPRPPAAPPPPETHTADEFDPGLHPDLAELLAGAPDREAVVRSLKNAGGNWPEIAAAIRAVAPERRADLLDLVGRLARLESLEATSEFLLENVDAAAEARREADWPLPDDLFRPYVQSPLFQNLHLSRWRRELRAKFQLEPDVRTQSPPWSGVTIPAGNPAEAARSVNEWVSANLSVRGDLTGRFSRAADPAATLRSRTGDGNGVAVFTAALLRTLAVPARVKKDWVEFHDGADWRPLYPHDPGHFGDPRRDEKTKLAYATEPAGLRVNVLRRGVPDPDPWEKFAISRFQNGCWTFMSGDDVRRRGAWAEVVPGVHLVTIGVRDSNGDAMVYARQLDFKPGQGIVLGVPMDVPPDELAEGERMVRRLDSIPALELPELAGDGAVRDLAETLRARSVALTFFSLDGEPSVRMLPQIDALRDKAAASGVELWAVYVDPEGRERFMSDGRLDSLGMSVLLDSRQEAVRRFIPDFDKNRGACLPSTLLIRKGGPGESRIVLWDEGYNMAIATAIESGFNLLDDGAPQAAVAQEPRIAYEPYVPDPDSGGEGK